MKNIKAIIFDLDGTLLDTIQDITKALNYALSKNNFPIVTIDEAKYLVGSGAKVLIERALDKVSKTYSAQDLQNVYDDYMYSYNLWKNNTTKPYQSVVKTIHILKRRGIKLCVLSNKPERDTIDLINLYFKGEFDIVCGSKDNVPLKPDPQIVNNIIEKLHLTNDEVAYVGDSEVDMLTGKNASVYTVGCSYGFRSKKELVNAGACITINSCFELISLFAPEPHGIILLDKGYGISSQEAITKVKRIIGSNKIGHAGTLDPLATGLLVVLLGNATKLSNYLLEDDKKYFGEITIGRTTDTLDLEGKITVEKAVDFNLTEKLIDNCLQSLIGEIDMEVPKHSAIKVNGKKLYEMARNNVDCDLPVKKNYIYSIKRESAVIYENNICKFTFSCHVSKGTYIRKLCEEIGNRLNYPAYMTGLRRISSGKFTIDDAIKLENLNKDSLNIISMSDIVKQFDNYEVNDYLYNRVINGMPIRLYNDFKDNVFITYKDNLIAIYEKDIKNDDVYAFKAKRIWK